MMSELSFVCAACHVCGDSIRYCIGVGVSVTVLSSSLLFFLGDRVMFSRDVNVFSHHIVLHLCLVVPEGPGCSCF